MSKVSKLLDKIAAAKRAAAEAVFVAPIMRPGLHGGRVLRAQPTDDLVVPIVVDGKPGTLLIPAGGESYDDPAILATLIAKNKQIFESAMECYIPSVEYPVQQVHDHEGRSLYAPVKRRSYYKRKRHNVFDLT